MSSPKQRVTKKLVAQVKPFRLDIGGGQRKEEGWTVVDLWEGADVVHDLFTFPWPFKDNSVDEARMLHFLEHVPGKLRFKLMDEVWRIMKPDARLLVISPYYSSFGAIQDPTHEWPPLCDMSFAYFNKPARVNSPVAHYPVMCDFDTSPMEYEADAGPPLNIGARNEEFRAMAIKHYWNVVQNFKVWMTKKVGR